MAEEEEPDPDSGLNDADRHGLSVEKYSGNEKKTMLALMRTKKELAKEIQEHAICKRELQKSQSMCEDLKELNSQQAIKINRLENKNENLSAEKEMIEIHLSKANRLKGRDGLSSTLIDLSFQYSETFHSLRPTDDVPNNTDQLTGATSEEGEDTHCEFGLGTGEI